MYIYIYIAPVSALAHRSTEKVRLPAAASSELPPWAGKGVKPPAPSMLPKS